MLRLLPFLFLPAVAGCGSDGPRLHAVKGVVRVNGQPAERVTGNAAHPAAVTDAQGRFAISTDRDGDGAVGGEYAVTFTWQSDPDPDKARDLFNGAHSDPKRSKFRAKVKDGATDLDPFELAVDPKQVKKFVK